MASLGENWASINDIDTLKAMLAAQQEQLQQLQCQKVAPANQHSERKRKATKLHSDELSDFPDEGSEEEAAGRAGDDDEYDPADDSDYDVPKKKQSSSKKPTSVKKGAAGGRKKKKSADSDDLSDGYCSEDGAAPQPGAAQAAKSAAKALRSIRSAITAQMVYRPSLKYGTSRVSLELPCLPLAVITSMLGPNLLAKASNGKKQLQLKASQDDLDEMFSAAGGSRWGCCFSKSLRYGATLGLVNGLTITYNKTTETLKVHGSYTMHR